MDDFLTIKVSRRYESGVTDDPAVAEAAKRVILSEALREALRRGFLPSVLEKAEEGEDEANLTFSGLQLTPDEAKEIVLDEWLGLLLKQDRL